MRRFGWMLRGLVIVVAVGLAGCRAEQTSVVTVDGMTIKFGPEWRVIPASEKGGTQPRLGLVRRSGSSAEMGSVMFIENGASHGGWTMDSARLVQSRLMRLYQPVPGVMDDPLLIDGKPFTAANFDVTSGKYTSVCAEGRMGKQLVRIDCEVVGSPLSFMFYGTPTAEPSARALLSTLE